MKKTFFFLILGFLVGPVLAQDLSLTYAVTHLGSILDQSEVSIQVDNIEADEIWNVNVRLESGDLGICPAVFQLGRIPAGGMQMTRSTCVVSPEAEIPDYMVWRIDWDSSAGHQQILTNGFDVSNSAEGGP